MVFGAVTGQPQGVFDYEGLQPYVTSGTMTLAPGVTPSVCQLTLASLPFVPPSNGTLTLSYGDVQFSFYNCKLDTISTQRSGTQTWIVVIYDRRWMWADRGVISGQYNVRINEVIQETYEKTPREMVSLCLDALGEVGYDVSMVPDDQRPEVDWDWIRPSSALSELLDTLGCVLCLGPSDNRVYVIPNMFTTAELDNLGVTQYDQQVDPPDPPYDLVIVGAKVRYQQDFLLEPMMLDVDGKWLPADEVSYAPTHAHPFPDGISPWAAADELFDSSIKSIPIANSRAHLLTRKYLGRAYRIIPDKSISWGDPYFGIKEDAVLYGLSDPITDWRDIELLDTMAQARKDDNDVWQYIPALVWGTFDDQRTWASFPANTMDPFDVIDNLDVFALNPDNTEANGLYTGGFSIDSDHSMVIFSDPVCEPVSFMHKYGDTEETDKYTFCRRLFLRTACHARVDGVWQRYTFSSAPTQSTNPATAWAKRYEIREDIEQFFRKATDNETVAHTEDEITNNNTDCDLYAQYYWNTVALEYQPKDSMTVTYVGFRMIGNDGAIRQITWSVGEDGKAYTRISRNREEYHLSISYKERRVIEKNRVVHENAKRIESKSKVESRQGKSRKATDS